MNDLHAELLMRSMARDAEIKRDKDGQFAAGPGASPSNEGEHKSQAAYHSGKSEEHRKLGNGKDGLHNLARKDHVMAASAHTRAAADPGTWKKAAQGNSAAAEKSSAKAHAEEPGGTKSIVTPQAKW